MKKLYVIVFALIFGSMNMNAQSIDELKAKKAELAAKAAEAQATADALNGEIGGIQKEIDVLTGWMTGIAGNLGFDFNKSNNWVAAPNPNSSSTGLGLGLTAYANKMTEKTMWRNKGILNKAWQDIDLDDSEDDGLEGTVDILNISSLYGYRIHPKVAISALGELNSSVENFLKPGTLDFGAGATWTPSNNLVVVVHPLNYHIAWPQEDAMGGVESSGALGAKIRADYTNSYNISGKAVGFSSTFTTFVPYSDVRQDVEQNGVIENVGLFNYSWLNSISFELWKGIGVGVGFGLRGSDLELKDKTQSYYNLGLSYGISR